MNDLNSDQWFSELEAQIYTASIPLRLQITELQIKIVDLELELVLLKAREPVA